MKFKYIIITILIFSFIGLAVIFFIGGKLSSPYPAKIDLPLQSIPATDVTFLDTKGDEISGWYVRGEKEFGGILLMHGVKSNRLQMVERATFLNKAGYSVLLFDFQAHGESPGKSITFGYLEAINADAAYNYLNAQLTNKSIAVIGVSLGGAAALLSSIPLKAKAIVLESVYPTIGAAVKNRICLRLGSIGKLFSPLLLWQMKPRLGFSPDKLKPIDHIENVKGAILIIAGENDLHTTFSESKIMFQKAQKPKEFWGIPNAAHVDFCSFTPVKYKKRILNFLNRNMTH